jgi:hypothetical protein
MRRRVTRGHDDRARVDCHARCELDPVGVRDVRRVARQRLVDAERGSHGSLRIVAVRHRCAEERKHTIAGQLGDRPVEAANLPRRELGDLVEEELRALRPEALLDRRRVDDVADQHGDDPTLAVFAHVAILTPSAYCY